jgi:hypothetical protein
VWLGVREGAREDVLGFWSERECVRARAREDAGESLKGRRRTKVIIFFLCCKKRLVGATATETPF